MLDVKTLSKKCKTKDVQGLRRWRFTPTSPLTNTHPCTHTPLASELYHMQFSAEHIDNISRDVYNSLGNACQNYCNQDKVVHKSKKYQNKVTKIQIKICPNG